MIAAPMPLLWGHQDIVAALGQIDAKAIITCSRIGAVAYAERARQAAVELFSIRHVCGFGPDLPDGVVPLDGVFGSGFADIPAAYTRPSPAALHVAAITFGLEPRGITAIARNHIELVAGGLEIYLAADIAADTPQLSTIPIGSFAGVALTLLPWLLSGGTQHLHHGFDPDAFAAQCGALGNGRVMLPAAAVAPISDAGLLTSAKQTAVALWRAPERMAGARPWESPSVLVDVASFGEIGVLAAHRGANRLPAAIPYGAVDPSHRAAGAPVVIETTRGGAGRWRCAGAWSRPFRGAGCGHALRLSRKCGICRYRLRVPCRCPGPCRYGTAAGRYGHWWLSFPSQPGRRVDCRNRPECDHRRFAGRRSRSAFRRESRRPDRPALQIDKAGREPADIRSISAARHFASCIVPVCR